MTRASGGPERTRAAGLGVVALGPRAAASGPPAVAEALRLTQEALRARGLAPRRAAPTLHGFAVDLDVAPGPDLVRELEARAGLALEVVGGPWRDARVGWRLRTRLEPAAAPAVPEAAARTILAGLAALGLEPTADGAAAAARLLGLRDLEPGPEGGLMARDAAGRTLRLLGPDGLLAGGPAAAAAIFRHFEGALPPWLAPEQVRVVPLRPADVEAAATAAARLVALGARATAVDAAGRLAARVAAAAAARVPFVAVVGPREAARGELAVRVRGGGPRPISMNFDALATLALDGPVRRAHQTRERSGESAVPATRGASMVGATATTTLPRRRIVPSVSR